MARPTPPSLTGKPGQGVISPAPSRPNEVITETVGEEASYHYDFDPKTDITAYELAAILKKFELNCTHDALMKLPEAARRHFNGRPRNAPPPRRAG
jgi:hypothetical protein